MATDGNRVRDAARDDVDTHDGAGSGDTTGVDANALTARMATLLHRELARPRLAAAEVGDVGDRTVGGEHGRNWRDPDRNRRQRRAPVGIDNS